MVGPYKVRSVVTKVGPILIAVVSDCKAVSNAVASQLGIPSLSVLLVWPITEDVTPHGVNRLSTALRRFGHKMRILDRRR